jgi:type 1 glutamine amidotransferase
MVRIALCALWLSPFCGYSQPAGADSVRFESSWATFRTAAADLLGWKVAVPASSLEAAVKADAAGVAYVELPAHPDRAMKAKLRALNLKAPVMRTDSADRRAFETARDFGVETLVLESRPPDLAALDQMANEFAINVAVPGTSLGAASPRVGIAMDLADARLPVTERLMAIRLRGKAISAALLRELYRAQVRALVMTLAPESLDSFERALHPVMTDRVAEVAKTMPIRSPDRLTPDERGAVEAAIPARAPAKPAKPRKLLVLDLNIGWTGHAVIPQGNLMLDLLGKRTGAWETVFSNDLENLKYSRIRQFDAVFLNSTVGQVFVDPEIREGLVRFVKEGGGLGGLHGASYTSMDWPEFGEMIGASEGPHRVEKQTVKVDDPNSPVTAMFQGKPFPWEDEFYHFYATGPYSRKKLHVLLSLQVPDPDPNTGKRLRLDHDYGLSWIHNYGKGRVFFCALGHTPALYTTPAMVEHVLAGVQYILGDLK